MAEQSGSIQIIPETRVGAMLDEYPQLEELLIQMAPAFSKLRNPVLRRTVAKVATLRQVAKVGGISIEKLINDLRTAVGQNAGSFAVREDADANQGTPDWVSTFTISETYDARGDIESGTQPMGKVLGDLRKLKNNEMYELITPFSPAPLIDIAKSKGYRTFSNEESPGRIKTYFATPIQSIK
ncbi:MAG: DUF1858 domain-containing protein [Candidatus Zixiibacteriota bacterium]